MKPKLIVILLLLVLIPLGLISWLGVAIARQEQERVQQRMQQVLTARLADLREHVDRLMQRETRALRRLTELPTSDAEALRDLVRERRLVRQVFVLAPDKAFLFPPPDGPSDRERAALQRLAPVWQSSGFFHRDGIESGTAAEPTGWHTWLADEGVQLFFWRRPADGRTVGIELDATALLADIIGLLPSSDSGASDVPAGLIALQDARNLPLYQWGDYRSDARELPVARLALAPPLTAWSLEYYAPAAAMSRKLSGSALFNVGAAVGVVALALIALAITLYRDGSREMRAAAQKVSFVNHVSHELKTPLTNIRLYAELLEERIPDDDPKTRGHLAIIISESHRLSRLIGNILTFARQQKARPTLHPAAGAVDAVIADTLDKFRQVLEDAGLKVTCSAHAGRSMMLDADVLAQILGNLFSNVEKYACAGQSLEVTSRQAGARTEIRVSDRGPGIPAGQGDAIFRPFVRLRDKLTDGVSGTGIGLTIARDLARLHGGDITLERSDIGACFKVVLHTPAAPQTGAP